MSQPLWVRELTVHTVRGFPAGIRPLSFSEQLNVVYGPNASGKTTLSRILQWFLWPDLADASIRAEAVWEYGGERWPSNLIGVYATQTFVSGDSSIAQRYRLAQHELLSEQIDDQELCKQILREARGGLDLDKVKPNRWPKPNHKKVREAWQKLQSIDQLKDARNWERELAEKEIESKQLSESIRSERCLSLLKELQHQASRLEELQRQMAQFPDVMEQLAGDELQRYRALREQVEKMSRDVEMQKDQCHRYAQQLEKLGIDSLDVARDVLNRCGSLLVQIERLSEDRYNVQRDIPSMQRRRDNARQLMCSQELPDAQPLNLQEWNRLVDALERLADIETKRHALDEILREVRTLVPADTECPPDNGQSLRTALDGLLNWLAAPMPLPKRKSLWWIIGLTIVAALYALWTQEWPLLIYAGLVLVLALSEVNRSDIPTESHTRQQLTSGVSNQLEKAGLPVTLEVSAAQRTVHRIVEQLVRVELRQDLTKLEARYRQQIEGVIDALQRNQQSFRQLLEGFGICSEDLTAWNGAKLAAKLRYLIDWAEAESDLNSAVAKHEALERQIEALLAQLGDHVDTLPLTVFRPWAKRPDSVEAAEAIVKAMSADVQQAESLTLAMREAENHLKTTRSQLQAADQGLTDFLSKLELCEEEAEDRLIEWTNRLDEFKTTSRNIYTTRDRIVDIEQQLRDFPQAAKYERYDMYQLVSELQSIEDCKQKLPEIERNIGALREKIQSAKQVVDYEEAQKAYLSACDTLHREVMCDLEYSVTEELVRALKETDDRDRMPAVYHRANSYLQQFTQHRYKLYSDWKAESFQAEDMVEGVCKNLSQLSSATRIHLLMAVRLAFIEQEERDRKLPLFLDETLACTDTRREREIIDAVLQVAASGRQVFYLTSKPHEADTWRRMADERGIGVRRIDMEAIPDEWIAPVPMEPERIPAPQGMTHAEYRKELRVPRWDPLRQLFSEASVWYVVDEPEHLYALMKEGIRQVGQLHGLLAQSAIPYLSEAENTRYRRLCEAMRWIQEAARVGHGNPVPPELITQLKSTKVEELLRLLEEEGGNGPAFWRAVNNKQRISRMNQSLLEQLKNKLEEAGCLPEEQPLSRSERFNRVLRAAMVMERAFQPGDVQRLFNRVWPDAEHV